MLTGLPRRAPARWLAMPPAILDNGDAPAPGRKVSMDTENRPVLTGLIALVGVAVAIGLLGGLAVMVGVKATGIGDSSSASDSSGTPATFNLPRPSDTGSSVPETDDSTESTTAGTEPTSEAP